MRDSKGDREIPEEVKNDFEDQEPFLKEKLKTLKDMIVDRFPVSNASYKNIWKYWLRNWLSRDTLISFGSSHLRCSIIKGVLRNFAKVRKILQKETLTQVFSCELCEISKNTFFTAHLWTTISIPLHKNTCPKLEIKTLA